MLTLSQPEYPRITTALHGGKGVQERSDVVYPFDPKNITEAPEEMVFRVQGFVVHNQLPPVLKLHQCILS